MATKKFIIEVEEGKTMLRCEACPMYLIEDCTKLVIDCTKYNLATMKIKEMED